MTECDECGDSFDWEDRISFRDHLDNWHNFDSYTCAAIFILKQYSANIELRKVRSETNL